MVTEIAHLRVDPSGTQEFEEAVMKAKPCFQDSAGCLGMKLERVIEVPGDYHLVVRWDTLEAHTVTFRESERFATWRSLVSPFFREAPQVVHCEEAFKLF